MNWGWPQWVAVIWLVINTIVRVNVAIKKDNPDVKAYVTGVILFAPSFLYVLYAGGFFN